MSRADALERYRELAVPGTSEEHWRFTDLRGFDPEAFSGEKAAAGTPASMLALDVAAEAVVTEDQKSTRLNSSHTVSSYAVFCLKKKKEKGKPTRQRTQ